MELQEIIDTECFLCGGPLVDGHCIAYHWNDSIHRDNRKKMEEGLQPQAVEPITIPENGNWGPCWVCGARTDAEGRCTRVNDFVHDTSYSSWMNLFHSKNEAINAPPVTFLINGFLQREGVTGLAAPVRERKSLIAINVVHALVTGEKLFGHFEVVKKPERVLYLCPEVSLGPFTDRIKKIGLLDYVGTKFFYRTMSSESHLDLSDPKLKEALPGSVIVLDTAIRFLTGSENDSGDIRAFADGIFSLLRDGAEAVLMLHHSPKDSGDVMTLESALRGSGDMGAFLACCWGTKLQDPAKPYESASYLENLKQRDFESQPFEVTCGPDCRMRIVSSPDKLSLPAILKPRRAFAGNKDGMDAPAIEFLKANPKLSARDAVAGLMGMGIKRGKTWVLNRRYELMQEQK